jgi:2-polyprenyl-3-methyl-5-hydroxy-6-metoxy-1,4-benzoquinol methylase
MGDKYHYNSCPVCNSEALSKVLVVTDNTVSKEGFQIMQCGNCTLRFTQDIPTQEAIGVYYKSEDYISHTDTKKGFINRLYHTVRKRALVSKRKLVQSVTALDKGHLLDLGSGTGAFANEMKQTGWSVTGLEPDPDARKVAFEQYQLSLNDTSSFYHLTSESFDAITMWHVLEHVHELDAYIGQLKNVLKPAGKLLIAVPNYTSVDGQLYAEHWAAYDVPRHLYHFSPASMKQLMDRHGLKIIAYKPLWFDSFYISLLSSKYKNGSTNWIGAVLSGIRSNVAAMRDVKKCSSVIYVISK